MATHKVERCPHCKRRMVRNADQNRRLWAMYHAISEKVRPADDQTYSVDSWHEYFKSRFLGCDDVDLPNGKTLVIPRSTANLDVGEFSTYIDQVTAWAAERDVFLEDEALA